MTTMTTVVDRNPAILKPGEGKTFWILGDRVTAKLGPGETEGRFALAEITVAPGGGPPPHVHSREDEMFVVLDGVFQFLLGGQTYRGTAGSCVYLPKGVVHTFKNVGDRPGRFLAFSTPCGFERFFATVATPTPPPETGLDPAIVQRLLATAPDFGIDMAPPLQGPPVDAGPCPDGKCRWVLGSLVNVKLGAAQTNGNFTVAEITLWPGADGPPPHSHRTVDELFYVLDGTVEFHVDGRVESHGAGSLVYVPRGITHTFRNANAEAPARVLDVHTPGGFEAFFEEVGVPATDRTTRPAPPATPPDRQTMLALLDRHAMDVPHG